MILVQVGAERGGEEGNLEPFISGSCLLLALLTLNER